VEHDLDATDGVVRALVTAEIPFHDLDVEPCEVRAVPGREVVEDPHVVTAVE
jgi:hypothetical protein